MKKLLILALAACAFFNVAAAPSSFETVVIKQMEGNVICADAESVITLKGQRHSDGVYYSNVLVEVADKEGKCRRVIKPAVSDGYNPDIMLNNFEGGGVLQIFFSIEKDGGYFAVFDAENSPKTLFDSKTFDKANAFKAVFQKDFKARVSNGDLNWTADFCDSAAKDMFWQTNGAPKKTAPLELVSQEAFPYYNAQEKHCRLAVVQKPRGADLCAVVTRLTFEKDRFEIFEQGLVICS